MTTRHTWIAGRTTPSRRCWAPRSSASRGACPSSSTIAGGTAAESTWPHKIPSSSGSRCASATPRCAALVLSRASQLPDRSRSAATRRLTFASLWVARSAFWLQLPDRLWPVSRRLRTWLRIWQLVQQQFCATGIAGWNCAICLEFRCFSRKLEHALEKMVIDQVGEPLAQHLSSMCARLTHR